MKSLIRNFGSGGGGGGEESWLEIQGKFKKKSLQIKIENKFKIIRIYNFLKEIF